MNKFEIFGIIVMGTVVGNRICDIADYVYKKRKRAKIVAEANERGGKQSAFAESDEYSIEELIMKYGDLL